MEVSPVELGLVDRRAEESVIRAMLDDEKIAVEMTAQRDLEGQHFYDTRLGMVFDAIRQLTKGIEPVDYPAIVSEVNSRRGKHPSIDADYLDSIEGVPGRYAGYAGRVKRLSQLRSASKFAGWILTSLQNKQSVNKISDGINDWVKEFTQATLDADNEWVWGGDTLDLMRKLLHERKDTPPAEFTWPWATWNERILPLREGMVGIVAAPDGMGKSLYLECIAEHWAYIGKQVALVHLEDSLEYKLDRRLARWANVPLHNIERGMLSDDQWLRVDKAEKKLAEFAGNLHYYHAPGQSMSDIVAMLEKKHEQGLVDVVVFDYIDKVAPSRGQVSTYGTNPWERQANDMEQLKVMAEKLGIPVITATQGNKEMQGDGTQTRRAIQGSGQKSQKAQLVVILTREILEEPKVDEQGRAMAKAGEYDPIVTVRIDKQNRGTTGSFSQMIQGPQFRVRDIGSIERQSLQ